MMMPESNKNKVPKEAPELPMNMSWYVELLKVGDTSIQKPI
jgi:hypothetical protein